MNSNYIIFDIETVKRPLSDRIRADIVRKLERKNLKTKTIEQQLAELEEKRQFMPGQSQIVAIGFYNYSNDKTDYYFSENENEIANLVSSYLATFFNEMTKLVGFNIKGFDLQQLMILLSKSQIEKRFDRYSFVDLMNDPFGYYTDKFSLEYYSAIFGLSPKKEGGDDIQGLIDLDKKDNGSRLRDYCLNDVKITKELFDCYSNFYSF